MATTSRFNPVPGAPYGGCQHCQFTAWTQDDSHSHGMETLESSATQRGHSIHVQNPTRAQRIKGHLESDIETAVIGLMEGFLRLLYQGDATAGEVHDALARLDVDLPDAWKMALEENGEDDQ